MSPFNGFIVAHPKNEILYNGTKKTPNILHYELLLEA